VIEVLVLLFIISPVTAGSPFTFSQLLVMTSKTLPETHKALVLSTIQADIDLKVQDVPTPQATPGSVVVKVLFCMVVPYATQVYNGTRPYPMPLPLVIGSGGIARVVDVGPDATKLRPGHLVLVDSFIRGRDDADVSFLGGLHQGKLHHRRNKTWGLI
jgi:hypothetical protein